MNDVKSVKEFAEKNAGKKFKCSWNYGGREVEGRLVGHNNGSIVVIQRDDENGWTATSGSSVVFVAETTKENLWGSPVNYLTPIDTPSEPQKPTKKQRKVFEAGKVLQETLVDIKGVYTRIDKETGKLYTIVELKNGAKAEVTLQDGDKFDPYKAVLYGREKCMLLREKKLKAEKKAAIELLKAEGDRQESLAEARRLVRHW